MVYKNADTLFMGGLRDSDRADLETLGQLLGYDIDDPAQLHGFIQNIAAKIKGAIQKRRAADPGVPGTYSLQTPRGTIAVTDTGTVSATTPKPKAASTKAKTAGFMDMIQKNPLIIVAAGAAIFLMMGKKKR